MGGGGGPIYAGNLDGGIPYLQESLMWVSHICRKPRWGDPIPTGSQMWDPISAGNLDGGGGGIPYLQET